MKPRDQLVCLIILSFFTSAPRVFTPFSKPLVISSSTGYIVNSLSGKCMTPKGSGTSNGTIIQLQECVDASAQYWEMTSDSTIWNANSGKCLDVVGAPGTDNGLILQLWDCEAPGSPTDQRWTLTADGYLQSQISGRCADVPGAQGTASGSVLQIWDCEFNTSNTDQRWYFQSTSNNSFGANNRGFANPGNAPEASAPQEIPPPLEPRSNGPAVVNDLDGDGISQEEENWLANNFTPIYYLDVDEPEDYVGFAYQVHPKTLPDGINQDGVILTIVALYRLDTAYPVILPVMGSGLPAAPFAWHNGDAEAVELWLTRSHGSCNNADFSEQYQDPNGTSRCYILRRMVIHRHMEVYLYEIPAPPGIFPVTFDTSLEDNHSTPGNRHPWLNISKGKHAAYIHNFWECDKSYYQGNFNIEDFIGILKTKEYCSDPYESNQAGKAIFPYFDPSQNVGEVGAKLFTKMQNHPVLSNFWGEDIWDPDKFCGGIVTGGACSGGMAGKWCGGGSSSYCASASDYLRNGIDF
jgi:hypothetical protein